MIDLLKEKFITVRKESELICEPLETEDYQVQTIFDVSPPKWHLAHTTWFYEEFILDNYFPGYKRFHPVYAYQFNSYYNHIGDRVSKDIRGIISRPTVKEIYEYRKFVNEKVLELLDNHITDINFKEIKKLILIGLNHEQQHQELCIYDIKHIFYLNPLKPIYHDTESKKHQVIRPKFHELDGGLFEIGCKDSYEFAFDNEYPRHKVYLKPYRLQNRLITNYEYLQFIEDNGYKHFEFWLSDGWDYIKNNEIEKPMYWEKRDNDWLEWTFNGYEKLDPNRPVSHISFYESYAFAKWSGMRLPTEAEWEHAYFSLEHSSKKGFWSKNMDKNLYLEAETDENLIYQMNGFLWEWTSSPYSPYPGYKQANGAIGEYNGKFMSSQMVLKGASYGTSATHFRASYRNFFQADKRWLFNGIRLAEDL